MLIEFVFIKKQVRFPLFEGAKGEPVGLNGVVYNFVCLG
jgi:hypothetical protein